MTTVGKNVRIDYFEVQATIIFVVSVVIEKEWPTLYGFSY